MRHLIYLIIFASSLLAKDFGELSLIVMKDGKPLSSQEFTLKENNSTKESIYAKTDIDGYFFTILETGKYQIQLLVKDGALAQAFVRKNVIVEKDLESQVIISLKTDNTVAFIDMESPKDLSVSSKKQEKKKVNGTLLLTLKSSEDKKSISNAKVFVKGHSIEAVTNKDGFVEIELPEGEQTLSIIHQDFSAQTIKVDVIAKEVVSKLVDLSPSAMELEEFVVLAPNVEGSIASLTAEKKNSSSIADVLGSQQMSKKGDSNAASALKRVSGITLVDGKNVYVRGLGERYANVELNSMALPSPNPYKRIVPLDIFPASIIGSLKVQKSYSADLSGNFAGGYIDIRTKEDVSDDYAKISISAKAHSSAFDGTKGNYYDGGASDYLGIDDGTRAIPDSVLSNGSVVVGQKPPSFNPIGTGLSEADILAMTKDIAQRDINTHQKSVPLGGKVGIEFAKKIDIDEKNSMGVLANYTYDQSHKSTQESFFGYSIDGSGNIANEADTYGKNYKTYAQFKQNGMLNVNYNYDDIFKVKYTKLYLLDTIQRVRITDGVIGSDSELQKFYSLDWEERLLNSNQISGTYKHHIFTDMKLDFGMQYTTASLNQPNNVKYNYIDYSGTGNSYELKTQSAQNLINHNLTTDDEVKGLFLNELIEIEAFSDKDNIEFGFEFTSKTRESRSNKYFLKVQNGTNITFADSQEDPDFILDKYVTNSSDAYADATFLVQPLFSPSDYYDADLLESGLYLKTLLHPSEVFDIAIGVRKSDVKQTLHEYGIDSSTGIVVIKDNEMLINTILPNIDMRYKLTKDDQLRLGFSQTYIYPDFREFSSSGYFHPDEAATVNGNPDLVPTDIMNLDLRYEHYFSASESFSTALFYKYLDKPIEDISLPSTSLPVYSYDNSDYAILVGTEFDIYKNLDFIDEDLDYYYMSGNLSYTYSDVSLSAQQQLEYTNNHRALQGLSPIVVNASFGYDNTNGRSINFSYNYMSERIRKVGLKNGVQEHPDQYEIPPHILDFAYKERMAENIDVSFKARNILDGEVVWKQGDNITKRYKSGRSYDLSLSYKY